MSPWLAAGFFLLGLLTRLPFGTEFLWAHDSVLYARAVERFAPLEQRPQAPGYLYYVLLVRAVNFVTGDPNRAMTLISAVAGAAAVALLYLLAARLYDERTARASALFLLTAVTFWAYGGVAYPYTLLGALSIGCALLFWGAMDREASAAARGRRLLAASAVWGVALGFRSDLAPFLAPLWLLAAAHTTLRASALGAGVIGALFGLWYAASAVLGGGFGAFAQALGVQAEFVDRRYSVLGNGLAALGSNAYELGRFLGRGLYAMWPLLAVGALSADARRFELRDRARALFLLLWALVPLPIYLFVHVGEYGYVFSMVPALCIIAARGAVALAKGLLVPRALVWIVAAVALADAAIFLLSDSPISARDVARRDQGVGEKVAWVRANFPGRQGDLIVTAFDTLLVEQYLGGGYVLLALDPGGTPALDRAIAPCPEASCPPATIVAWDDLLRTSGPSWHEIRMPHGASLRVAAVARPATLRVRDGLALELLP